MDKTKTSEFIQNCIKELEAYKTKDPETLSKSKSFSNLVYKINQTISLDAQLQKHYEEKITYFDNVMNEANCIVNKILEDFKQALKLIDVDDLEQSKSSQKCPKRSFNIILEKMSIPFSNGGKEAFSANDMINCIINYDYDIEYSYRAEKPALNAISKLEKLDMQHLYNYINDCFKYVDKKDLFNQSSEELIAKLKKLLVGIPQKEFIYNYVYTDAIIYYYNKLKNNDSDVPHKKHQLYYFLVYGDIDDFVEPLIQTLWQLDIFINSEKSKDDDKNVIYQAKILNNQLHLNDYIFDFSEAVIQQLEMFLENRVFSYKTTYINKNILKKYKSTIDKKIKEQLPNLELLIPIRNVGYKVSENVQYKAKRKIK